MATHNWYDVVGAETVELVAIQDYRGHLSAVYQSTNPLTRPIRGEEGFAQTGDSVLVEPSRVESLLATSRFAFPEEAAAAFEALQLAISPPRVPVHHDWHPVEDAEIVTLRALRDFRGKLSRVTGRVNSTQGFPDTPFEGFAHEGDTVSVDQGRVEAMLASGAFERVEETETT